MNAILMLIVPLFAIMWVGYLLRRHEIIKEPAVHFLNRLIYLVSLPAVVFSTFAKINWSNPEMLRLLGYNTLLVAGFMALVLLLLSLMRVRRSLRGPIAACAVVGNTVYMGFPLGAGFFGDAYSAQFFAAATPHLVIGIAFAVLAIEYFAEHKHSTVRFVKDFVSNPLIIALTLGMLTGALGIASTFLVVAMKPIEMLGATASPLALLTLGAFFSGKFRRADISQVLLASLLKLTVFPVMIYALGYIFLVPAMPLSASILAASMPTAVTVFTIADRYRAHTEIVAGAILFSTLMSFATLAITLLGLHSLIGA